MFLKSGKVCHSNFQNVFLNIILEKELYIYILKRMKDPSNEGSRKQRWEGDFSFTGKYICVWTFACKFSDDVISQVIQEFGQNGTSWGQSCWTVREWSGTLSISTPSWGVNVNQVCQRDNRPCPQTSWALCNWRGGMRCLHPESGLQRSSGESLEPLICVKQQRRGLAGCTGAREQCPCLEHLFLPQGWCRHRMELFNLEAELPSLNLL